jgi:hypothetical protein
MGATVIGASTWMTRSRSPTSMPSSSVLVETITQSRASVNACSERCRSSVESEACDRNVVMPRPRRSWPSSSTVLRDSQKTSRFPLDPQRQIAEQLSRPRSKDQDAESVCSTTARAQSNIGHVPSSRHCPHRPVARSGLGGSWCCSTIRRAAHTKASSLGSSVVTLGTTLSGTVTARSESTNGHGHGRRYAICG